MRSKTWITRLAAVVAVALALLSPAFAGTKNKVESKDGHYLHEYESDRGVKSKYEAKPDKIVEEYEDADCKYKYEEDLKTGEVKVEKQGDCAR